MFTLKCALIAEPESYSTMTPFHLLSDLGMQLPK